MAKKSDIRKRHRQAQEAAAAKATPVAKPNKKPVKAKKAVVAKNSSASAATVAKTKEKAE